MAGAEFHPESETQAALELDDGAARISVYYAVATVEGETIGYLRLAYGQGSFVNKVLNSVGHRGRLVLDDGASRAIRITSSDPTEAPGYLCTFSFSDRGS